MSQPEYGYQQAETRSPWHGSGGFPVHSSPVSSGPMGPSDQQFWRFNQVGSPGDYAPFQVDSMHPPPHPHNASPFAFSQQRPDQFLQQQARPMRSTSYGQIEGVTNNNGYPEGFHPSQSQGFPSMGHAPPSLAMQDATAMSVAPGPHSAPITQQHHIFMNPPSHYAISNELNHVSSTSMIQHPTYAGSWYHEPAHFAPVEEEQPEATARELPRYIAHTNHPG